MTEMEGWRPTSSHIRALLGAALISALAVVARRPDLIVLATPLLIAAVWAELLRPTERPSVERELQHSTLHEGEATRWTVRISDPTGLVEDVASAHVHAPWLEHPAPRNPRLVSLQDDGADDLAIVVRPIKWGRRQVRAPLVVASSALNGFRSVHEPPTERTRLFVLPQISNFDATTAPVRSAGLVGANRSRQAGSGTEFAGVRPFVPGDRVRRIHWPESLRSGELHVTSTWADQDRHVVVLIDAFEDIGRSGGVDGRASSLDISVRAASAVAQFHIARGNRVTTITMGSTGVLRVPPSSGLRHVRRVLQALATIKPSHALLDDGRLPSGIRPGTLVLVFSPLTSPSAFRRLARLANRGLEVVAIDCLPPNISTDDSADPYSNLAWRIELLRRDNLLEDLRSNGLAVVPWKGPGSLDVVLQRSSRRDRTIAVGNQAAR